MNFEKTLFQLQKAVMDIGGLHLVWKDADPGFWTYWNKEVGEHLNSSCQTIKENPDNLNVCYQFENNLEHLSQSSSFKTCPFGLQEWRWTIYGNGKLLGNLLIGIWKESEKEPPSLSSLNTLLEAWGPRLAEKRLQEEEPIITDSLLEKSLEYMEDNLGADLRLVEVAGHVKRSPSRLRHRFIEKTGRSFSEWMRSRLMKKAALRLIHEPQLRTIDLALDLGWKNERYFSTVFKNYFGEPPGKWRKRVLASRA